MVHQAVRIESIDDVLSEILVPLLHGVHSVEAHRAQQCDVLQLRSAGQQLFDDQRDRHLAVAHPVHAAFHPVGKPDDDLLAGIGHVAQPRQAQRSGQSRPHGLRRIDFRGIIVGVFVADHGRRIGEIRLHLSVAIVDQNLLHLHLLQPEYLSGSLCMGPVSRRPPCRMVGRSLRPTAFTRPERAAPDTGC